MKRVVFLVGFVGFVARVGSMEVYVIYNDGTNAISGYVQIGASCAAYYTGASANGGTQTIQPGSSATWTSGGWANGVNKYQFNFAAVGGCNMQYVCGGLITGDEAHPNYLHVTAQGCTVAGGNSYTNYVTCYGFTNRDYVTGQRVTMYGYSNGVASGQSSRMLWRVGDYWAGCATNLYGVGVPFSLIMCGERSDYDTPECVTFTASGSSAGNGSSPSDVSNTNTPPQYPGMDTNGIVRAIGEAANKIARSVDTNRVSVRAGVDGVQAAAMITAGAVTNAGNLLHSDLTDIKNGIYTNNSYTSTGNGIAITNTALASEWRRTNGIVDAIMAPYRAMTNFLGTNGFEGASNTISGESLYVSNQFVSTLSSREGGALSALQGGVEAATDEDRSVWMMPCKTNLAGAIGFIDLNPLHSRASFIFDWMKLGIKFWVEIVVFLYMSREVKKGLYLTMLTPGSGLGKQNIWFSALLFLKSNAAFGTAMLALIVAGGGAIDTAMVSLGGWFASPFSATVVALFGVNAKYLRVMFEIVDAVIPISYLGIAMGTLWVFDLAVAGTTLFWGRFIRALTE